MFLGNPEFYLDRSLHARPGTPNLCPTALLRIVMGTPQVKMERDE